MSQEVHLQASDATVIREALYAAKFALEQDVDGPEKNDALKKINDALDKLREP